MTGAELIPMLSDCNVSVTPIRIKVNAPEKTKKSVQVLKLTDDEINLLLTNLYRYSIGNKAMFNSWKLARLNLFSKKLTKQI